MCARGVLGLFSRVRLFCDPMNGSPPGFTAHGILQAGALEWVAIPSSGDLPDPAIEPTSIMSLALADSFFTSSPAWEAQNSVT